jgi:hypothetical protein
VTRRVLLLLAALLVSPVSSQAQTTLLVLQSQPGDYIGAGLTQSFNEGDGSFQVNVINNDVSFSFHTSDNSQFWTLAFGAPNHAPLAAGVYEGATRAASRGPGEAGLDVFGDGRGCNQLTGRFEVLEVTYGSDGNVTTFAATFEQHCEGATPALLGTMLYNANTPVPPQLTVTLGGCLHCHTGDQLTAQITLRNPGTHATQVEIKAGVRLPDGTGVSIFGPNGQHLVISLPAGFQTTFPALNVTWSAGTPAGVWHFEGTLLEPGLGRTFSRDVKTFEVDP